tara:strand:+ start:1291 stop:2235 length:945 start_codon:yes stop_codon:yes gene_type:complete
MELENPELKVSELLADISKLAMRVGELNEWDLDEIIDLFGIENDLIDDDPDLESYIDYNDPDFKEAGITKKSLMGNIKKWKEDIAEFASGGDKDEDDIVEYMIEAWDDNLPIGEELLQVILARAMDRVADKESEILGFEKMKGTPMTFREVQWEILGQADNFDTFSDAVDSIEYDAEKEKERVENLDDDDEPKRQKYNINNEAMEYDDFEDGEEVEVREWVWRGKTYLLDDREQVFDRDTQEYIGLRYEIDDDEEEQFMSYDQYTGPDDEEEIAVVEIPYKGKTYLLDPDTYEVYDFKTQEKLGVMKGKKILFQ